MAYIVRQLTIVFASASLLISCAPSHKNITVVVSLDAFRWDYPDIYDTPALDSIASVGVKATMLPSYPASTFPNHYTMATGLVPDHHGIVNSQFWDKERGVMYSMGDRSTRDSVYYYGGEPIWVTAEKQGVKTGNVYWVGSDIAVEGITPTYFRYWYDEPRLDYSARVEDVLRLLRLPERERPRLVMCYFDDPDWTSHEFGPRSIETGAMVHYLDSLMGRLCKGIKALPYGDKINVIITADHGMTDISPDRFICIDDIVKPEWVEVVASPTPTSIFCKPGCVDSLIQAFSGVDHVQAWKKEDVPSELCYGTSPHLGEVIVAPDLGWRLSRDAGKLKGGHGYSPMEPDMQVAFRAFGPDFKNGFESPSKFVNVDIYPLIAHLLGIKPMPTDGDISRAKTLLK